MMVFFIVTDLLDALDTYTKIIPIQAYPHRISTLPAMKKCWGKCQYVLVHSPVIFNDLPSLITY